MMEMDDSQVLLDGARSLVTDRVFLPGVWMSNRIDAHWDKDRKVWYACHAEMCDEGSGFGPVFSRRVVAGRYEDDPDIPVWINAPRGLYELIEDMGLGYYSSHRYIKRGHGPGITYDYLGNGKE